MALLASRNAWQMGNGGSEADQLELSSSWLSTYYLKLGSIISTRTDETHGPASPDVCLYVCMHIITMFIWFFTAMSWWKTHGGIVYTLHNCQSRDIRLTQRGEKASEVQREQWTSSSLVFWTALGYLPSARTFPRSIEEPFLVSRQTSGAGSPLLSFFIPSAFSQTTGILTRDEEFTSYYWLLLLPLLLLLLLLLSKSRVSYPHDCPRWTTDLPD